jgi:hypothetical protein
MPIEATIDGKRVRCRRIEVGWGNGKSAGKTTKVFCRRPKKRDE